MSGEQLKFSAPNATLVQNQFHVFLYIHHFLNGQIEVGIISWRVLFVLQWTLMSYMIEGGGSTTLSKSKSWLYRYPEDSHKLLQMLTDVIVRYLIGQVEAGAQVFMFYLIFNIFIKLYLLNCCF